MKDQKVLRLRAALRRGGRKGGKSRWGKLTRTQRSDLARKMAKARWGKEKRA